MLGGMEWILNPEIWASLITLTLMEIVLGIDNLVFLTIAASSLPEEKRLPVQRAGLAAALFMRIGFLAMLVWVSRLAMPVFWLGDHTVSWRDMILLGGGLFLLWKGTREIHSEVEGNGQGVKTKAVAGVGAVILQIMILDLVFSMDSIITAIGLTDILAVMITAITIAIAVMMFAAKPVGRFVEEHPTTKMLALAFLILIGASLVAEGMHFHIPRGFIYFAISFSLGVEALNLFAGRRRQRQKLRDDG